MFISIYLKYVHDKTKFYGFYFCLNSSNSSSQNNNKIIFSLFFLDFITVCIT